jgi:integral membrane protein (TIGR01906 family)
MNPRFLNFLSFIVTLLTPIALLGLGLRLLLSPFFLQIEYNMPYFPADEYGLTKQDRLHWAPYAVDYLVNNANISYLGDLKFEDGSPLYNERELSHMEDVKRVTQGALRLWNATLATLLLLGCFAYTQHKLWESPDWMLAYLRGLWRGGWLMVGLALTMGAIVLVGIAINPDVFWEFFALFHKLFFTGNSWLFYYSDTLIRLFPIRFWQDAFLLAAVIALGGGLGLAFGLKPKAR